ncbi:iron response transcriptional regulator IrrA [Oceanibacterium hippocampi]|uniref:Ferric uptake regulation protein n=1 Tax=Oceanibacterium hippocampi TaxID=745714 RepID=A0A1Y5RL67_9PROT|nr:Fur family transcriptional regulator [Oceanibacterium hippocampi]SLN18941.1 Peroxide-responsive repressor PerR [Oceanibacterium hippocampi]
MTSERPFSDALRRLREAGLRPTRQRLALAKLLFDGGDRHITAEGLHEEALGASIRVSLATIYNSLHQFTAAGMLREVVVDSARSYFDTNTEPHHHFFFEGTGDLADIPGDAIGITSLPAPPEGMQVSRVDVVIRVSKAG